MSQKSHRAQLIIEWDREWVRVHFVDSSQTKEASSLDGIDSVNGKSAIIMLSRRLVLQRSVPLPDAQKSDALIALKMRLADIFPIPASELAFDFLPTTEKNENGRVCNVFAARTSDIAEVIEQCQRLGIQIQQIVPSQAVTLKVAEQQAVSSGVFAERFGDFVNLDAYRYGDLVASKLVTLNALDTEVSRMIAMTGDGSKVFAYNVTLNGSEQKLSVPFIETYAQSPLAIDLEPEEYRLARDEKARAGRHRFCYLIFMLGIAVAGVAADNYMTNADAYAKAKATYDKRTKKIKLTTDKAVSEANKLKPQADQLVKAFEPAQQPADILKVVSSCVPKETWLTGLTFERGKILQIRGTAKRATLVSAYLLKLTEQPRLRDVRLVTVNGGDIDGIPTVQFTMSAFPVGNIPMIDTGKKKK